MTMPSYEPPLCAPAWRWDWLHAQEPGNKEYLSWLPERDRLLLTNPGELEYRSWLKCDTHS